MSGVRMRSSRTLPAMVPPRGILETVLYVDDLAAAERFYSEVLGLTTISRTEGRSAALRCHHDVLLLFDARKTSGQAIDVQGAAIPRHGALGPGHMAFAETKDELPKWIERLGSLGVPIESHVRWPGGAESIYFRDPAGNSVELATPELWDARVIAARRTKAGGAELARWEDEGGDGGLRPKPTQPLPPGRARDLIELLGLAPHPEGGWFKEQFRSDRDVIADSDRGRRCGLTTILFLLAAGEHSRWHRVASDEAWHLLEGGPLELLVADATLDGVQRIQLQPVSPTHRPDHVVPAHCWQAARPLGPYALCACTVGPGFDFKDFEFMAGRHELAERIRQHGPEAAALL